MMKKNKYQSLMMIFLGKEKYKEITKFTIEEIHKKFGKQSKFITDRIIQANHSAVLIIATLKARDIEKEDILNNLHINDFQSNKFFIEEDIDKFMDLYSEYINIIVEKIKANFL